jgi:hypothetical protein
LTCDAIKNKRLWSPDKNRPSQYKRDVVVAPRADFTAFRLLDVIDLIAAGIASRVASADAFVVTDAGYRPRNAEESLLYQVVAGELETFLTSQQDNDRNVPRFVEKEFRSFLDCGVLPVICCGLHWLSSVWSVFPAHAWHIG